MCSAVENQGAVQAIDGEGRQGDNGHPSPDFQHDLVREIHEELESEVPHTHESDLLIQDSADGNQTSVDELNKRAFESFVSIVQDSEKDRLTRLKPLQYWLLVFVGLQLIVFNFIIGYLVVSIFRHFSLEILDSTLNFLKYYIGAVVVELVGMIGFITQSTFASTSKEIIKGIFKKVNK